MKRDMDLVRAVLLSVEESTESELDLSGLGVDGWDQAAVAGQMETMIRAGLIDGSVSTYVNGDRSVTVRGLTWDGHDLLNSIRIDSIWLKVKSTLGARLKSASFGVVAEPATELLKQPVGL